MESGVGNHVQLHLRNTRRGHSVNVLDVGGIPIKTRANSLELLELSNCLDQFSKLPGKVPEEILDELSLFQTDSILIMGEASPVIFQFYRNCRYCWPADCRCL